VKQNLFFALLVLLLLLVMPLCSAGVAAGSRKEDAPAPISSTTKPAAAAPQQTTAPPQAAAPPAFASLQVLRTSTGATQSIPLEEYLVGCVAAEMDANCHSEALKAQAVASYTYARYRLEIAGQSALSDSGDSDQGYISRAQRQERWGGNFETYEAKIGQAVRAVSGQTITYGGQPIFAAYHAVSAGRTESAEDYWGQPFDYLQSVESPGDKLSPDYSRSATLSEEDMRKALEACGDIELGKDPAQWFGAPKRSGAGGVMEIAVGGKPLTGREVRALLGLRSTHFTIEWKDGRFRITCLGYGHGVGMSQYGADFMARQGSGYREILEHYYTGCTVG